MIPKNFAVVGNISEDASYGLPAAKTLNDITGFGLHFRVDMYGEQFKAMT
jgi:hypothetical protein